MSALLVVFRRHFELSKKLTQQSASADTEAFLTLYQISTQDVIWRGQHKNWEAFLANEGVSASRWYNFRSGFRALKYNEARARELGRPVVCRLGNTKLSKQAEIAPIIHAGNARKLLNMEGARDTLPMVKKAQLLDYVDQLKKVLKKSQIKVPKAPWE